MYEYQAKLKRIIDGDTIDVDIDLGFGIILKNKRIRLKFVDTPEVRTRDLIEKQFGKLASKFVHDQINKDSKLIIRTSLLKNDKFGRILGEVFIQGETKSLNLRLINEHHAVYYTGQSKELIRDKHLMNRKYLIESGAMILI